MFVLWFIFLAVLFGLGFLNALWWVAAAVLVFVLVGRGWGGAGAWRRGGDSDYGEYGAYRDYRDREDRWDRRYRRQRQGRWRRQDRRDHEHHR